MANVTITNVFDMVFHCHSSEGRFLDKNYLFINQVSVQEALQVPFAELYPTCKDLQQCKRLDPLNNLIYYFSSPSRASNNLNYLWMNKFEYRFTNSFFYPQSQAITEAIEIEDKYTVLQKVLFGEHRYGKYRFLEFAASFRPDEIDALVPEVLELAIFIKFQAEEEWALIYHFTFQLDKEFNQMWTIEYEPPEDMEDHFAFCCSARVVDVGPNLDGDGRSVDAQFKKISPFTLFFRALGTDILYTPLEL